MHIVHLSQRRRAADDRARRGATGVRLTVETCPHYLTFDAEEIPDGATAVQVLPADPRGGQPRALWAGAGRRRRSTASSPTTRRAPPDLKRLRRRRLRRGVGRHRLAAARPAGGVDRGAGSAGTRWPTWSAGWPRARPRLAGLAGKGRIAVGARRRPGRVRARTRRSSSTRPGCTTGTRSRRTPAAPCAASSARPGCAAHASTSTDEPRGRLLTRGEA